VGGRFLAQRFDWDCIAEQTAVLFRWLLLGGESAEWVRCWLEPDQPGSPIGAQALKRLIIEGLVC
jgi:hypothetical protein